MKVIHYGEQGKPVIMMLHGGGLSWWNYRREAELLSRDYHVVLPVLDGHAESNEPYTGIEDNADKLIAYIHQEFAGKIKALCGLSLGAQTALEMLVQCPDLSEYAVIESVSLIPSKVMEALISPSFSMSYGLIKQGWFSRLQFQSLKINASLYEDYYRDSCLISKEDLIAFMKANQRYSMKEEVQTIKAKTLIIAGEKEQKNMIRSAQMLHKAVKGSSLMIAEGLYHGEYSLNLPEEYVKNLISWMET